MPISTLDGCCCANRVQPVGFSWVVWAIWWEAFSKRVWRPASKSACNTESANLSVAPISLPKPKPSSLRPLLPSRRDDDPTYPDKFFCKHQHPDDRGRDCRACDLRFPPMTTPIYALSPFSEATSALGAYGLNQQIPQRILSVDS
jgi:hypothetical protein